MILREKDTPSAKFFHNYSKELLSHEQRQPITISKTPNFPKVIERTLYRRTLTWRFSIFNFFLIETTRPFYNVWRNKKQPLEKKQPWEKKRAPKKRSHRRWSGASGMFSDASSTLEGRRRITPTPRYDSSSYPRPKRQRKRESRKPAASPPPDQVQRRDSSLQWSVILRLSPANPRPPWFNWYTHLAFQERQ